MERYLAISLAGVALLILALALSFIAMEGTEIPKHVSFTYFLKPGEEVSIDVWTYTGAFSKNTTFEVVSNCSLLHIKVVEQVGKGKIVESFTVSKRIVIKDLNRFAYPKIVMFSGSSCWVNAYLTYVFVEMKYAWLSIPAFLAMFVGGAMLLIGGSAYLAMKIRRARISRRAP